MSPSFSTSSASTPVSSRTSRRAAAAGDSSPAGWPLGSASTREPSAARRVGTITMQLSPRTTTPPAETSESGRAATRPSEDVALERFRVVDSPAAAARGDDPGPLEVREEAAGRLARGARELGDLRLGDLQDHVARPGALAPGLLDEPQQH